MRITTVIPVLGAGGAEVVAVTVARAAALHGHSVTVASAPGFRVPELQAGGVEHVPVPLEGRSPAALLRAAARLRGSVPDLVHAHNPKATVAARLALGPGVPILTTLHGVADADVPLTSRILRWASSHVVAVAPYVAEQVTRRGFPEARVDVVPNAVEPLPPYSRDLARLELGIAPDAVVGLCLARMVEQKRHDLLVAAWDALDGTATLLLAGDGPTRRRIERDVERRRLGNAVHLLGERSDVHRLVAASDFLVLPTDWEGLPVSALEAMAAGLPVVASRVSGLAEQLTDGVLFVEPASAGALAGALRDVVGDPALRADLAARGRGTVALERFGADAMVGRYLDLYQQVAGLPRAPLSTSGGRR